mgnify:CR=1 FL=1
MWGWGDDECACMRAWVCGVWHVAVRCGAEISVETTLLTQLQDLHRQLEQVKGSFWSIALSRQTYVCLEIACVLVNDLWRSRAWLSCHSSAEKPRRNKGSSCWKDPTS